MSSFSLTSSYRTLHSRSGDIYSLERKEKFMSPNTFYKLMSQDSVVNPTFSREMPEQVLNCRKLEIELADNQESKDYYMKKLETERKAYHLGLIDFSNKLLKDDLTSNGSGTAPVNSNNLMTKALASYGNNSFYSANQYSEPEDMIIDLLQGE